MHIRDILDAGRTAFSFEFFPPKDRESSKLLFKTIRELIPLGPAYVSVTYGAGGSTRELTQDLVVKIQAETSLTVVSHLTCVGSTRDEIVHILDKYRESGIRNILALRGDPPAGRTSWERQPGGFEHAIDLVRLIKQSFPEMGIGVAGFPEGHPETPNHLKEMEYLKAKVDAGADYICTQLFFDNRDFYDFRERCELAGIRVPVMAGIMPLISRRNMVRMAELAQGVRYPARLLRSLSYAGDDSRVADIGIEWATAQVRDLLEKGVAGVHFYTLNRSSATLSIYKALGASHPPAKAAE